QKSRRLPCLFSHKKAMRLTMVGE
ncbi:general secretion pathway protein H, partial [Vibrio parahaemolyticus VPTS-2010]